SLVVPDAADLEAGRLAPRPRVGEERHAWYLDQLHEAALAERGFERRVGVVAGADGEGETAAGVEVAHHRDDGVRVDGVAHDRHVVEGRAVRARAERQGRRLQQLAAAAEPDDLA